MELGAAGFPNHTRGWAGLLELFAAGSVWMTCCCSLHDKYNGESCYFGVTIAVSNEDLAE